MNIIERKDIFLKFMNYISGVLSILENPEIIKNLDYSVLEDKSVTEIIFENYTNIYHGIQQATIVIINKYMDEISDKYSNQEIEDFKYLLSGFFDEVLLYSTYINEDKWSHFLIERYFFGTSVSGDKITERIFLHNRSHSMKDNDLTLIYYNILSFGYMGKLRVDKLKYKKLFADSWSILSRDLNLKTIDDLDKISENCYIFTFSGNKSSRFINYYNFYKLYIKGIIFAIFLMILIVYFITIKDFKFLTQKI